MSDRFIEVLIKPDGSVTFEGRGFKGVDCEQATKALEESLGKTVSDERTSEFYAEEKAKVSQW